ncbi:MAG: 1,4-alpha-glucan branching protein GlgB [Desulfobacterales bacterium]
MPRQNPVPDGTVGQVVAHGVSLLTDDDVYLFNEGSHFRLYEKLGAHIANVDGREGTVFGVWAPNASKVGVIGDFNGWDGSRHELRPRGSSGIWEGFLPGVTRGMPYKYLIHSSHQDRILEKADPFAVHGEIAPKTASVVWDLDYTWSDDSWMAVRQKRQDPHAPMSIYEVHLGSWMRVPEDNNRSLSYREMARRLTDYVLSMGYTHVELMPVMEHPFFGSWGYQSLGYFSPSSRYGTPQDFMHLIDTLHRNGIGVILDWVPSHFPVDPHGLGDFDGTHLFEHADERKGFHPDWKSYIFNYGRNEVRSFLISSSLFWLDKYHADGFRMDAVASMLYLNYSRPEGEWIPNEYGGNENLEAISFLRRCNEEIRKHYPGTLTIAEESTAWPMVSRPVFVGGLGFDMKWDMGWMHDSLAYFSKDPVHRSYHHNRLTFRMIYAFQENYVLPLSHDEVVHGKGSLLGRMPGDEWQRFANLRTLFGYMFAQPGKKLIFMGGEFGQPSEWAHDRSLDWHLLDFPLHSGMQRWIQDLNRLYRNEPAMHESDFSAQGFQWIDCNDSRHSTISLLRRDTNASSEIIAVFNFTPVPRHNYRVGAPCGGAWRELLNGDAVEYGGSGQGNMGALEAAPIPFHGMAHSLTLTLPPLAVVFFKADKEPS